jgi:hypothetical protein
MRLVSDRAYACTDGRLYIYGPLALEIERVNQVNQEVTELSKVTQTPDAVQEVVKQFMWCGSVDRSIAAPDC